MTTEAMTDAMTASADQTAVRGGLAVTVHDSLAAAESAWRALERNGVFTPYQRFDWISQCLAAGFDAGGDIAIVVFAAQGVPAALLPLRITRRFGVGMAEVIGTGISNADGLVFDPAHRDKLTPEALRAGFAALGAAGHRVDLVNLHCLVADWQGVSNPLLAFPHAPAPNRLYLNDLQPADRPYIEQSLLHKRRTNIRRSTRRLAENFGPLALRSPTTPEEIDALHAVFLDQREKRFRKMGVENVFADPRFQALFRETARATLGSPRPALRLDALYAGEQVLAISVGVFARDHYSQYINSTDDGPAAKYSLMGVLLSLLVEELRTAGITSFDMGLGDFDYKTDWTTAREVYDCVVPVSAIGTLAAPALSGARALKRAVKQTPILWRSARAVMALKARLAGRTAASADRH